MKKTCSLDSRPTIRLHLYCHGLGDCHLVELCSAEQSLFVLIDCGVHISSKNSHQCMQRVVADVRARTSGKRTVVVGTHEHWDHIGAFHPKMNYFDNFDVEEVWLGWTENPYDAQGRQLDRFKDVTLDLLENALRKVKASSLHKEFAPGLENVLNFNRGPKGHRSRDARDRLAHLARSAGGEIKSPRYLEPGTVIELPSEPKVRCYVLGPPRDRQLLGTLHDLSNTFGYEDNAPMSALEGALRVNSGGLSQKQDPWSPFDDQEGLPFEAARDAAAFLESYRAEHWRKIDDDWLESSEDLALQLDSRTNNTSLVLAFEIVKSGNVLLFAADAQVGNWESWADVNFAGTATRPAITGRDLLERVVFYKVGHHGSRNATIKRNGLDLMNRLEIAFIPTDRIMAEKIGWSDFPSCSLVEELRRKTGDRVILSDGNCDAAAALPCIRAGDSLIQAYRDVGPSLVCEFI